MSRKELDAAGIHDPALRASYEACRRLNAAHGKTYYLATLLLPPAKRPYVHALYGFARYADEIVDDLDSTLGDEDKARWLTTWGDEVIADVAAGHSRHPISMALVDTVRRWDIPVVHLEAFLASMRMDLTVDTYETYDDLCEYMYGSAAVIGLQMLPILEHPTVPREVVSPYARDLGVAFQMSNMIRDVGEDLKRGRIYLPQSHLAEFGVDRERLQRGTVDGPVRDLLAFEIHRTRKTYARARPGISLLHPTSQDCIRTAFDLYGGILDEVERADYQVLRSRVTVGRRRRLRVAGPGLARAVRSRRTLTGRRRVDPARPRSTA